MSKNNDFEFNPEEDIVPSNWFKFEKVGDQLAGTLISRRIAKNQLTDKDQTIYEIFNKDGDVWNVGGKEGIDAQMRNIKIGQIIAFYFAEEKPAKQKGYYPTKIIKVLTKGKINEEWLAQKKVEDEKQEEINVEF